MMGTDLLVNDFAERSFRDIGDGDYIAARMACRAELVVQFLWAGQQAIEKYLKCILLLNRIPAKKVSHDIGKALNIINSSGKITLELTDGTKKFIGKLNDYGPNRYLEVSNFAFGSELVDLDRAVWEVRRYCTLEKGTHQIKLRDGFSVPRVRIPGGYLEKTIDGAKTSAREALLWKNGFFGNRAKKKVSLRVWREAHNAPLSLNPHMLDEVLKYIYLPKDLSEAYRKLQKKTQTE
jgi:hypothetical protein